MLIFFTIVASNERRPPVYTLHLKCFPIKGEPRLVKNIAYKGYSPPKCTCNGHVPHINIHIPNKNMQFLLWNPTCHEMSETQSCTMSRVLTNSHHTCRLRTPRHFYKLSPLELCLPTTNGSFTRGGVYPCLLLLDTSFLYHIIQLCDSVGLHPT